MNMEPFYIKFQDVAEKETRTIFLSKESGFNLPEGAYYLLESYCNDPTCDCRRAFINIVYDDNTKPWATIGYGWEDISFYEKWLGFDKDLGDLSLSENMKGPVLEIGGYHTQYSDELLRLFKEVVLSDDVFISRLKNHYSMFKSSLKSKKKIGRNELCPCGSGKKYKKCCLWKK